MKISAYWKKQTFEADLISGLTANGTAEVIITLPGNKTVVGVGANYFEAVNQIRAKIEPHEWLLGINASRIDAGLLPDSPVDLDTITIIENETVQQVLTLGEAPQSKLATLEYQQRVFVDKTHQLAILAKAFAESQEKPKTGRLKKAAPTKRTYTISTLLTLLSSLYPLTFIILPANVLLYEAAWGVLGFLIYGVIVAINVENTISRGKRSFSLMFSITAPLIIAVAAWYVTQAHLI